jgi:putative transcriptional regulator
MWRLAEQATPKRSYWTMMTDAQLKARDAKRDIGAELLEAVRQMKTGQVGRSTTFEPLPDGSVRRTVTGLDGVVQKQEVLTGPKWQPMAAHSQSGMSQSEFARATGVSVRTLQEWEQGRKVPSGAAQSLPKLVSRHPELLAELA